MDDLISRAAAIDYLMTSMNWHDDDGYEVEDADEKLKVITDLVNGIPAVDAAQVVHGRPVWINPLNPGAKMCAWKCSSLCSVCGDYVAESWNYCPNCGARMDGERRDDDALSGR